MVMSHRPRPYFDNSRIIEENVGPVSAFGTYKENSDFWATADFSPARKKAIGETKAETHPALPHLSDPFI